MKCVGIFVLNYASKTSGGRIVVASVKKMSDMCPSLPFYPRSCLKRCRKNVSFREKKDALGWDKKALQTWNVLRDKYCRRAKGFLNKNSNGRFLSVLVVSKHCACTLPWKNQSWEGTMIKRIAISCLNTPRFAARGGGM